MTSSLSPVSSLASSSHLARAEGSDAKAGYVGGNAGWMLYFTSADGIHWDRRDLSVVEVAGRRDHNIVFASDMVPESPTALSYGPEEYVIPTKPMTPQGKKAFFWGVNKHPHPRDPAERYVALAIVQDHRRGAHIATSPDGIRWSCAASPFWQTPHDVASTGDDCLMHLFFDESKRKWVIYRRIIPEFSERMIANDSDRNRPPVDRYNRSYAYAESDDLKEWVVRHPRLYLNAATWSKGSIRAEVLTRDWQPIPGFTAREGREIQGDALDHPVTWSGSTDLNKLLGEEIRLKFHMTRARIHAMALSDDERPSGDVEAEYRSDAQGDAAPKSN